MSCPNPSNPLIRWLSLLSNKPRKKIFYIDFAEDEGGGVTTPLITDTQQNTQNGLKSSIKRAKPPPIKPKGTKEYIVSTFFPYTYYQDNGETDSYSESQIQL